MGWNIAHANTELPPGRLTLKDLGLYRQANNLLDNPSQAYLEKSLAIGDDAKRRKVLLHHMKTVGQSLEDTLNKYNIDIIIGPGDCFLSQYSAALG